MGGGDPVVVMGVDPGSKKAGVCAIEVDGQVTRLLHMQTLTLQGKEKIDRLLDLALRLAEILRRTKPSVVAVEAGSVGRFAKAALVVGEARGIAIAAARLVTGRVLEVQVQSARKSIGVAGFAQGRDEGKLRVRLMISKLLRTKYAPTEDEADAACLAWYAAGRITK